MESKRYIGKVFGHFRILEPLGHGGMGFVFKALNTHLNKIVAIKMIAPGLALNEKLLNRFKTEALALARLENPHIVRILDLLEDNGQWFIVMEYIEGQTLSERLKERRPMPLEEIFDITFQILSALQHAHSASIIHRDIKPSNILITKDNVVKVTDFGLAKIQANSLVHTHHSAVGGTLYYMSPEQVRSLKEADHRTDLYSLGITLYQMLTGRVPFDPHQTDFDIREAIVRREFPRPSTFNPYLPPEVDDLVMKALAKDPDERFQSAVEMMQEMERLQEKLQKKLSEPIINLDSEIKDEINYDDYPYLNQEETSEKEKAEAVEPSGQEEPPEEKPETTAQSESVAQEETASFFLRVTHPRTKKGFLWVGIVALIALLALFLYWPKSSSPRIVPASLKIYSQPAQAKVYLNGKERGLTPLDSIAVTSGQVLLRLEKDGYLPFDTTLTVHPGVMVILRLALLPIVEKPVQHAAAPVARPKTLPESAPASSAKVRVPLMLISEPPGASLVINGKNAGVTPFRLNALSGERLVISLNKAGYFPLRDTVLALVQGKHRFSYVLKPEPVRVNLRVKNTPAVLFVDGAKKGIVRGASTSFTLAPGPHLIKLEKDGYHSLEKSVNVQVNTPLTLNFTLQPLKATLHVLVLPWGNIYIDGKLRRSETNVRESFELSAGPHRIKVTHPKHGYCQETIRLKPDGQLSLVYDFNKPVAVKVLAFDEQGHAQYARIVVDDQVSDQYTPGMVNVPLGEHRISVQKQGFIVKNGVKEVMVTPSFVGPIKFILKPISP